MVLSIAMTKNTDRIEICFYNNQTGIISRTAVALHEYFDLAEVLQCTRSGLVWLEANGQRLNHTEKYCRTYDLEINDYGELVEIPGRRKERFEVHRAFLESLGSNVALREVAS